MIPSLRQNLTRLSLKISSSLCKSDAVFTLPLLHFSTSAETQSAIHPTVYEFLVQSHHFSPQSASKVASVVSRLRNPEMTDSILSFLKESGFSISQLEKMVECTPQLLSGHLENIKPKFMVFQDFGISANDAVEIIATDPWIFWRSLNNSLIPSLSLLKDLVGSTDSVKILKASGWFLKSNLENGFAPNVELLKKCGISMDHIIWMIYYFPRLLLRRPEDLKQCVDRVDELGISRGSKNFIYAVRVLGSMSDEIKELKLQIFKEAGFTDDDIACAFRKAPFVFCLSAEKIKDTIDVILASGKYDLSCIIRCPTSLGYSIGKRLKPHLRVLKLLERKKLIKLWPGFSSFCIVSNKDFCSKYVSPFAEEIGDVYMVKSTTSDLHESFDGLFLTQKFFRIRIIYSNFDNKRGTVPWSFMTCSVLFHSCIVLIFC